MLQYCYVSLFGFLPRPAASALVAFSTARIREVLESLSMKPSIDGKKTSFEMKFGSPYIDGSPFIWSESRWARFKLPEEEDCIPDAIDGAWNPVKMFME